MHLFNVGIQTWTVKICKWWHPLIMWLKHHSLFETVEAVTFLTWTQVFHHFTFDCQYGIIWPTCTMPTWVYLMSHIFSQIQQDRKIAHIFINSSQISTWLEFLHVRSLISWSLALISYLFSCQWAISRRIFVACCRNKLWLNWNSCFLSTGSDHQQMGFLQRTSWAGWLLTGHQESSEMNDVMETLMTLNKKSL